MEVMADTDMEAMTDTDMEVTDITTIITIQHILVKYNRKNFQNFLSIEI